MRGELAVNYGRPTPGIDPDSYAKQYANEKGITLEEAKAELRAMYGDPQPQGMSMNEGLPGFQFSRNGDDIAFNPFGGIPQDPTKLDKFIEDGARKAGCSPKEFAQMMGIPPKSEINSSNSSTNVVSTSTTSSNICINGNYTSYNDIESVAEDIYRSGVKYETTRSERKDIKKQTKNYVKYLKTYEKEYVKAHAYKWKSASSRFERKSLKLQVIKDAEQYAIEKFKQKYPDVDLSTVFYNSRENETGRVLFSHPNLKPYN